MKTSARTVGRLGSSKMTPLTERLTEENLRDIKISTEKLIEMFRYLDNQGYSAMNLKLIIDLIGNLEEA